MLNLLDIVNRLSPPIPWAEGDNIPWNDPGFSQRMLSEHLNQTYDAASRRFEKIDHQVEWINSILLSCQTARILDLGCGPGLYTERLAQRGHTCLGVDFSPASIEYARQRARQSDLSCTYLCQDMRLADFGSDFDLVMFVYGEFNVFRPQEALSILQKAWQALKPSGHLLLEVHNFDLLDRMGHEPPSWYTSPGGLFSERPHLLLEEHGWDAVQLAATTRYFLIDAATQAVTRYAASYQAYTEENYRAILTEAGYQHIKIYPSLGDIATDGISGLIAITACKD